MSLYTIGHGYETQVQFAERLQNHDIAELIDVRSFPGSRRSPHFSKARMPNWLAEGGIRYSHWADLGGRRGRAEVYLLSDDFWTVDGFRNYAAHSRRPEFRTAFDSLLEVSVLADVAIMCGEPCYWRCHRRMLSDLAVRCGHGVNHIMPNGSLKSHPPSGWEPEILT